MKRFRSFALSLATLLSVVSYASQSLALTIDEFTNFGRAEVISDTPSTSFSNVVDTSAIGGNRLLFIGRTSTFNGLFTSIVSSIKLSHSQDSGVRARSTVTWDKDSNPINSVNPTGLGSIDLLQDSGTALKMIISFDYANGQTADVKLKFFDSSDPSGNIATEIYFTLNQVLTNYELTIPFSLLQTTGAKVLTGPSSNIPATVVTTIDGLTTLSRVGAIFMEINGQNGDSDLSLDFLKTNGICDVVPDAEGDVIDDCGICKGSPGYKQPKDSCGYCPNDIDYNKPKDTCGYCAKDTDYNKPKDTCGYCPKDTDYSKPKDTCGYCPKDIDYNKPKDSCQLCAKETLYNIVKSGAEDPCGVCGGDGSSCADCTGTPNGGASLDVCNVCNGNGTTCLDCAGIPFGTSTKDICNVCNGNGTSCLDCTGTPFGTKVIDACNICGGATTDASKCNVNELCTTVQATGDILTFEKRLVDQATTIKKKFTDEKSRNKRNKCGINVKPSETKINNAYQTIKNVGNDIFTKGVEICGNECVTVSYADQVTALVPTLKIIEKETKSLANKVKACYKRKRIKTTSSVSGVQTTINTVQSELTQLIKDCKDKQVCPN